MAVNGCGARVPAHATAAYVIPDPIAGGNKDRSAHFGRQSLLLLLFSP